MLKPQFKVGFGVSEGAGYWKGGSEQERAVTHQAGVRWAGLTPTVKAQAPSRTLLPERLPQQ